MLVRRVKQGVAEWYRLQLKDKAWKGLQEHSLAGWNIGPAPYGYLADRIPHPVPMKASQGRTKSRLIPDPDHHRQHPATLNRITQLAEDPTGTTTGDHDDLIYSDLPSEVPRTLVPMVLT